MRAYLDETYGSQPVAGESRPVQMGSLRPPKREARVAQPPTTHDEEVAQRLYETLEASAAADAASAAAETPTRSGVKVRHGAGRFAGLSHSPHPRRAVAAGGCQDLSPEEEKSPRAEERAPHDCVQEWGAVGVRAEKAGWAGQGHGLLLAGRRSGGRSNLRARCFCMPLTAACGRLGGADELAAHTPAKRRCSISPARRRA